MGNSQEAANSELSCNNFLACCSTCDPKTEPPDMEPAIRLKPRKLYHDDNVVDSGLLAIQTMIGGEFQDASPLTSNIAKTGACYGKFNLKE